MNRTSKIIIAAFISILLVLATILFYVFDPNEMAIFPQCPFLLTTGYKCPGCGTQRALHDLLHLRLWEALKNNMFIVFAIPYILSGIYIEYFGGKQRHPKFEKALFGKYSSIGVFLFVILYWIIINL